MTVGVGGHGVVGVLQGAHPGPTVAYRADMDAVPSADQIGGGPEPAHLCGHDLHTVVGVGVAQILARLRHRLSGKLVFLFQPAEENLTGARAMLDDRVLERTRPQEIHALHCGPFPVGQFAVTPGTGLPGHDHAAITLTGPAPADQARQLTTEINALATVAIPQTPRTSNNSFTTSKRPMDHWPGSSPSGPKRARPTPKAGPRWRRPTSAGPRNDTSKSVTRSAVSPSPMPALN